MYNKRVWLNKEGSPSTGNVVAFDGVVQPYVGNKYRCTFLQVADCSVSARLVKEASDDTMDDFIDKMKRLHSEIGLFIDYLEKNKQG